MAKLSEKNKNISFIPQLSSKDIAGFIKVNGGSVIPSGWLECNGQAVSRETYSDLFDKIGVDFGIGDGATTFNLPTIAAPALDTEYIIKAYSDILGPSVSAENLNVDLLSVRKVSQRDETLRSFYSAMVSNFVIDTPHTWTIEANADLVSADSLTINGTVDNDGIIFII